MLMKDEDAALAHVLTRLGLRRSVLRSTSSTLCPVRLMPDVSVERGEATDGRSMTVAMAPACTNIRWHHGCVERRERQSLLDQKGCVVWITGLSGSGKSTLACALDHALAARGKLCYVLDGDNVRHGLCKDLGFSAADRQENIRRIGEVARLMADAGLIALVSCISPYRRDREFVRGLVSKGEFVEVYMNVPLAICEKRDCKGLYKLARAGVIKGFTGIDDPYEVSEKPEVVLEATNEAGELVTPDCMAETVIGHLVVNGLLSGPTYFPPAC